MKYVIIITSKSNDFSMFGLLRKNNMKSVTNKPAEFQFPQKNLFRANAKYELKLSDLMGVNLLKMN